MAVMNETETAKMTISTHHHILIVTGPAGCGKSTVAKHLSDRYGFDYIEGDEVSQFPVIYLMRTDVFAVPPKSKH